jgi:uncharacterized Zn-binding protein involved in type VI secretion
MTNINIFTKILLIIVLFMSSVLLFSEELDMIDGEDIQVNIVLTHPAGYSPKVFTTGWIFGAYATAKIGKEPVKDISNQVQWSGSGTFLPATGPVSRPSFLGQGANTIKLTVIVNGQAFIKEFVVDAVYPAGYAAIGTIAYCAADGHGAPGDPLPVQGPIITGSPNVFIGGVPAARKGDVGTHCCCSGSNTFEIVEGDGSVLINGRPAARIGSKTQHCGGIGQIGLPPWGTNTELEINCDTESYKVWSEDKGKCVCIEGYKPNQKGECVEIEDCPEENSHFDIEKRYCVCDDGYSIVWQRYQRDRDDKCYPIPECDESINESWSYWYGDCRCKDGYKKNDEDVCVPICNEENNEKWDKMREDCVCKSGFKKNKKGICVTICNEKNYKVWSEEKGDCVCIEGYKANLAGECIKIIDCDDESKYFDVEQNACVCNEFLGYYPTEDPDICSRFTAVRFEPIQFEGTIGEVASFNVIGIDQSGVSTTLRTEEIEVTKVGRNTYDRTVDGHNVTLTIIGIECDATTEYWNESERRCDCKDGFTANKKGKCIEDHDCDENEYWDEDTEDCECDEGYIEDEDGECVIEHDCNINEEWNETLKNCVCIEGYEKNEIDICESVEDEEEELIDDCSIEYIQSLAFLLEVLVAETKLNETELISYINKFNKEINDQSSDPCDNSIIAYCYYSATEIAARMAENNTEIYDLGIEIIALQEACSDLSQQIHGEGIAIENLISSISGIGLYEDQLAQMESRLRENGCDEDEVKDDGEKIVPPEEDPGFIQDGGISTEMPGDGDDNDGDGQQDEEVEGLSGYNITLVLYDSGSAADDIFNLSVGGYGSLGQTPAGGLRSYGLNLLPGSYTAVVTVVLAPDDVGTYTLTVLYDGESIGSITGAPPQGSSATLTFTVPSE